jgi:hypothetical protein
MSLRAGTFSSRPYMDLTFEVIVGRATLAHSAISIDTVETWTALPRRLRCDIAPFSDYTYFQQSGQQTIATHVIHFYANEDIREKDRVQFVHAQRLAGLVGSWYEIQRVLTPTETIAYTRAYASVIDAPIGITQQRTYTISGADTLTPAHEMPAFPVGRAVQPSDTLSVSEAAAFPAVHTTHPSDSTTPTTESVTLTSHFRPADITTSLWLDASDLSTITLGTGVSQWRDKSGNGNNVAQATGANQPTQTTVNSLNALAFNGSSMFLSSITASGLPLGSAGVSIFAVLADSNNGAAFPGIVEWGTDPNATIVYLGRSSGFAFGQQGGASAGGTIAPGTSLLLFSATYTGGGDIATQYSQWVNGTLDTTVTGSSTPHTMTTAGTHLLIGQNSGNSACFPGTLCELIVAPAQTTLVQNKLEGYLAWHWNTLAALNGAHPYKSVQP